MDKNKPIHATEEINGHMADAKASAIFKEAFYKEAKALEQEALAHPVEVDEARMEAVRRRILEHAGTEAMAGSAKESCGEADCAAPKSEEEISLGTMEKETADGEPSPDVVPLRRKKWNFSRFGRWAAVVVLVCTGVVGVSMNSEARGSGLWSSIQRLIGVETRWTQENNGEDRSISDPDEYKALEEIEEKLGIQVPQFFYWPGEITFVDAEIFEESSSFMMEYADKDTTVFFEGWNSEYNASSNNVWQGEGKVTQIEEDGVTYTITEGESDAFGIYYYVGWTMENTKFVLSGVNNLEEIEKILKNIKN